NEILIYFLVSSDLWWKIDGKVASCSAATPILLTTGWSRWLLILAGDHASTIPDALIKTASTVPMFSILIAVVKERRCLQNCILCFYTLTEFFW
ncbi:MAG: hypothetical protein QXO97_09665, partial [Candidatus Nezhaarchaeales archaeon]